MRGAMSSSQRNCIMRTRMWAMHLAIEYNIRIYVTEVYLGSNTRCHQHLLRRQIICTQSETTIGGARFERGYNIIISWGLRLETSFLEIFGAGRGTGIFLKPSLADNNKKGLGTQRIIRPSFTFQLHHR